MIYLEEFYNILELTIGTRFYFLDRLYEVAESEEWECECSQCAFNKRYTEAICGVMKCNDCRHDKNVFSLRKLKKQKRKNND